jgi:hypothetical protein
VVWIFSSQGGLGDVNGSGDGVINVLGSIPCFLFFPRIMLGLDLFPVGCLSGLFCFLSDSYVRGGWGRMAVVVRVVHDDGVICRGIGTSDVFFCIGVCILCELHYTVRAHIVSGGTGTIALDVVAEVWRIVLTLQGDSDGCGVKWNCLLLHLLFCTGWCSSIPLTGQLLVAWGWPVRRPASDPGEIEVWHVRSADKLHAFGVLLMAFLKIDSSSIQDPAMNFILGLLHCGRWERSGLRQQRSTTATVSSFHEFICNFFFLVGVPCQGVWM